MKKIIFAVLLILISTATFSQEQKKDPRSRYYFADLQGNLRDRLNIWFDTIDNLVLKVPGGGFRLTQTGAQVQIILDGDFGASDIKIDATQKIFFDGGSDTYIFESEDNVIDIVVNSTNAAKFYKGGFQIGSIIEATANTPGNALEKGTSRVEVIVVVGDANSWILLPLMEVGYDLWIYCNAGSNFELRTPSGSSEKINNVDCSSGAVEYLCTDTDIIYLHAAPDDNWIAQSWTNLGALRTAVVPD